MKVLIERSPRRPLAERTEDELSSRTLLLGVLASSKTQARRSLEINHTHPDATLLLRCQHRQLCGELIEVLPVNARPSLKCAITYFVPRVQIQLFCRSSLYNFSVVPKLHGVPGLFNPFSRWLRSLIHETLG